MAMNKVKRIKLEVVTDLLMDAIDAEIDKFYREAMATNENVAVAVGRHKGACDIKTVVENTLAKIAAGKADPYDLSET